MTERIRRTYTGTRAIWTGDNLDEIKELAGPRFIGVTEDDMVQIARTGTPPLLLPRGGALAKLDLPSHEGGSWPRLQLADPSGVNDGIEILPDE